MQQILEQEQLNRLNNYIEKVLKQEKQSVPLNWDMILEAVNATIKNFPRLPEQKVHLIKPMSKEEIVSIALKFYKSLDDEMYNFVAERLLGMKKNVIVRLYDVYQVKDFRVNNSLGMKRFTQRGRLSWNRRGVTLNNPLNKDLRKNEAEAIKSEATYEDLFIMVHELAHMLDLDESKMGNLTRELLGEATSMGFEIALSDYLLQEGMLPKELLQQQRNQLMRSVYHDSRVVFALITLCKEKEKNSKITNDYLESLPEKYNYPAWSIKGELEMLLREKPSLMHRNRYAFGGLVAPTIASVLNGENGVERIKQYFEACKKDDFAGAMAELGITQDREGLNTMIKNMKESINRISDLENER